MGQAYNDHTHLAVAVTGSYMLRLSWRFKQAGQARANSVRGDTEVEPAACPAPFWVQVKRWKADTNGENSIRKVKYLFQRGGSSAPWFLSHAGWERYKGRHHIRELKRCQTSFRFYGWVCFSISEKYEKFLEMLNQNIFLWYLTYIFFNWQSPKSTCLIGRNCRKNLISPRWTAFLFQPLVSVLLCTCSFFSAASFIHIFRQLCIILNLSLFGNNSTRQRRFVAFHPADFSE